MSERIYKLWQARFTEAWYLLSDEDQQRLMESITEAREAAGGREVVSCSAEWSNERWPFFGVEEFPDLDAVQRYQQSLTDLSWPRYIESRTSLGTPFMPE
jgi:hypothetical protein